MFKTTDARNLNQFLIHIKDSYDHIYTSENIDIIFEALRQLTFKINRYNLRKYIVDVNLSQFMSSDKDLRRGEKILPGVSCIDTNFEIYKEEKKDDKS